jgi:hypothetical protein
VSEQSAKRSTGEKHYTCKMLALSPRSVSKGLSPELYVVLVTTSIMPDSSRWAQTQQGQRWLQGEGAQILTQASILLASPPAPQAAVAWEGACGSLPRLFLGLAGEAEPRQRAFPRALSEDCGAGSRLRQP